MRTPTTIKSKHFSISCKNTSRNEQLNDFYKWSINILTVIWLVSINFLVPQRFSTFRLPFFSCIDYYSSIKHIELIRVAVNRRIWDKLDQFLHFPSIALTKLHPSIANKQVRLFSICEYVTILFLVDLLRTGWEVPINQD